MPAGYVLVPGALHAYRVPISDLPNYVEPLGPHRGEDEGDDESD